jgi:hypothetical protein
MDFIEIKELSSFRADYENCFELFGGCFTSAAPYS